MDNTRMDLQSVKAYEAALEAFVSNVRKRCSNMHTGISSAKSFMKDETSQQILTKSESAVQAIENCLPSAERLLELVREERAHLENQPHLGL